MIYKSQGYSGSPESSEYVDLLGWHVRPLGEMALRHLSVMYESGTWSPRKTAAVVERLRPESDEYVVLLGRQRGRRENLHVALLKDIEIAGSVQNGITPVTEERPGIIVQSPAMLSPEKLGEFLTTNSQADTTSMDSWSPYGDVPYLAAAGSGDPGNVVIGSMNATQGIRTEVLLTLGLPRSSS